MPSNLLYKAAISTDASTRAKLLPPSASAAVSADIAGGDDCIGEDDETALATAADFDLFDEAEGVGVFRLAEADCFGAKSSRLDGTELFFTADFLDEDEEPFGLFSFAALEECDRLREGSVFPPPALAPAVAPPPPPPPLGSTTPCHASWSLGFHDSGLVYK